MKIGRLTGHEMWNRVIPTAKWALEPFRGLGLPCHLTVRCAQPPTARLTPPTLILFLANLLVVRRSRSTI